MKKLGFFVLIYLILFLIFTSPMVDCNIENENNQPVNQAYQFKLYIARGELSLAENYYETAIQNFQKAIHLKPDSAFAHDLYEKAVTFKKLGIESETFEGG